MKRNTHIKKVGIYCNAFSVKDGGGISYILSIANSFIFNKFSVDLYFNSNISLTYVSEFYLINRQVNLFHIRTKGLHRLIYEFFNYEVIIRQSNSIPGISLVSNSFVLCDFPFQNHVNFKYWIYLKSYKSVIVNSNFTGNWVAKKWNKSFVVIYPPTNIVLSDEKENIILSVGRIVNNNRSKNFPLLINVFRDIIESGLKNWKFIIAGFVQDENFLDYLKNIAADLPIEFCLNISKEEMDCLYSKSSIYWHACGYQVDERINPNLVEHFGISIANAIISGSIPIAINKGGAVEFIRHGYNGFLWNTLDEIRELTLNLISNKKSISHISKNSITYSNRLTQSYLNNNILNILDLK